MLDFKIVDSSEDVVLCTQKMFRSREILQVGDDICNAHGERIGKIAFFLINRFTRNNGLITAGTARPQDLITVRRKKDTITPAIGATIIPIGNVIDAGFMTAKRVLITVELDKDLVGFVSNTFVTRHSQNRKIEWTIGGIATNISPDCYVWVVIDNVFYLGNTERCSSRGPCDEQHIVCRFPAVDETGKYVGSMLISGRNFESCTVTVAGVIIEQSIVDGDVVFVAQVLDLGRGGWGML